MNDTNRYLQTAIAAARLAGKTFTAHFGRPRQITAKGGNPHNLVTEVDVRIENNIRRLINKRFPAHGFLGEETGWEDRQQHKLLWIIDPIDGTTNYIQGIPLCCISIALWDRQGPLVGVIYNPLSRQLFSAARGRGAYLNGKKVSVSAAARAAQGLGGLGWSLQIPAAVKMFSKIMPDIRKARALGTTALQLAYVAAGIYDFYIVNDMHVWDVAAGILLVTEAGGRVTDWQGGRVGLSTSRVVASNGKMHLEFLRRVKKI